MIRSIHVATSLNIPCSVDDCGAPACQVLSEDTDGILGEIVQAECSAHLTPSCDDCGEISCTCREDEPFADLMHLHTVS